MHPPEDFCLIGKYTIYDCTFLLNKKRGHFHKECPHEEVSLLPMGVSKKLNYNVLGFTNNSITFHQI